MANHQIPTKLLDEIQILLRKEAHLEYFNPHDPSLPSPLTMEVCLATLESSVDHSFRCKHCKGGLLRGSDSIVCVYCGHDQLQNLPPQPLSFNSTLGFGWLLQSLGLDSSEGVEPLIGHTQSYKGESSVKDEISLSDLLDLKLKWPDELNRCSVKNKAPCSGRSYLNLVGVDIGNILAEGNLEHASHIHSEQATASEKLDDKQSTKFQGLRNLSLFENPGFPEATPRTDEGEPDESSTWEAEFQSAIPDTKYENLPSSNVSILSQVECDSHTNSVFQPAEPDKTAESSNFPDPSTNSLANINLSSNSGAAFLPKQSEGNMFAQDGELSKSVNTLGFNRALEVLQKNTSDDPYVDKKRVGDDSIDEWREFKAVTGSESNQYEPNIVDGSGGLDISDAWNEFTGSVGVEQNQLQTNFFNVQNDDSLSTWANFAGTSKAEVFQSPASATKDKNGDSFGFWNNFKSSAVERQQETNNAKVAGMKPSSGGDSTIDLGDSTHDPWSDIASLGAIKKKSEITSAMEVPSNRKGSHDDSFISWNDNFDEWNNLTGSTDNTNLSGVVDDFSTSTVIAADQHHGSSAQATGLHTVLGDDDLFKSWSDFKSSGTQVANDFLSSNVTDQNQIQIRKTPENQIIKADVSPFSSWGDFGSSAPNILLQASDNKSTGKDHDFFYGWSDNENKSVNPPNNQLISNGVKTHNDKGELASVNDVAFDSWSDFTSSGEVQANCQMSNPANAPDHKQTVKHGDPYDSWDVFTGSSKIQASKDTAVAEECTSESNLFSSNANSQGVGSHDSGRPDLFMLVDQNNSPQVAVFPAAEVPDLFRINTDVTDESYAEPIIQSQTVSTKISEPVSSEAETLISEMHDLSFMLENTLSIPNSSE